VASAYNKMRRDLDHNTINLLPASVAFPSEDSSYEWMLKLTPEEENMFGNILKRDNDGNPFKNMEGYNIAVVPCVYEMRTAHVPPNVSPSTTIQLLASQETSRLRTTYDQLFVMRIPSKHAKHIYEKLKEA
jgi:hypothetical protein